ncbi:class I SAM-dependent methyltransferase [Bacillus sp. KH172YL63]|uniref:class I SAM-dependent methyltransferase n=1 Tax=Bacillus sp. KH172YL63 TaxID=2709784 RepID=UPI0013E4DD64|nr:class I SAM-dependent methyltransferase [Bacillus sp. KH172YL63]BCB04342.1 putative methyltransferase YdaC [Bacillus sp. KH172YL63]
MFSLQKQFKRPDGILGWVIGKVMEIDNRKINNWSLRQLGIKNGERVLEIGYGPGYCIHRITSTFPDTKVDGVDISETMKESAESKNQHAIDHGRVRLFIHDISKFQLDDVEYDRIFSVNNYPLWSDKNKALAHLHNMLKPGGTLIITVQPRGDEERDSRAKGYGEEILKALQESGFKNITISYKDVRPALTVCVKCTK